MILGQFRQAATELNVLKHTCHGVVVLNRDRVELVVVATGATHGDAHYGSSHSLHDLIHPIRPSLPNGGRLPPHRGGRNVRTRNQKTHGVARTKRVSRNLFANELVVRHIEVKGSGDVIPINPGVLPVKVGLRAVGLSPTDNVQPVLGPSLAEMRGRQKFLHQADVGRLGVSLVLTPEGLHPLGSRRHTRQDDGRPPYQGPRIGGTVRLYAHFLQPAVKEGVHGIYRPCGDLRSLYGQKGPVGNLFFGHRFHLSGPNRSLGDPLLERGNLIGAQGISLLGHAFVLILALHKLQ